MRDALGYLYLIASLVLYVCSLVVGLLIRLAVLAIVVVTVLAVLAAAVSYLIQ